MPVKHRVSKMKTKFTPEAVELFRRGCEIIKHGDQDFWECDGGRKSEYIDLDRHLKWGLLAIHPGDDGPLHVEQAEQNGDVYEDQAEHVSPSTRESMPRARQLWKQLKKAIGQ